MNAVHPTRAKLGKPCDMRQAAQIFGNLIMDDIMEPIVYLFCVI